MRLLSALTSLLILFPIHSYAHSSKGLGSLLKHPSNHSIITYIVYRESRGQNDNAARAVLDVVNNRLYECNLKKHCSLLEVVSKRGAFPYIKHGIFSVRDEKFLHKMKRVSRMAPVMGREVLYFNSSKHSFGRDCKKLDKIWFCKGE